MTPRLAIGLNALGLLAICIVLLFAFSDQLVYGDLPCPLCILQRAGLIAAGFGLALNMRFGPRPSHYGLMIIGALAAGIVARRQVLLHIVPGTGSYGDVFFGLHFYTWMVIVSTLIILGTAGMLLFDRQFTDESGQKPLAGWILASFGLFGFLALANGVSTVLECAGGLCPDDPTGYLLLQ
ncbi:MAG: disulfide bond formation protein B [Rhizobiales bacterium]|nr:disulfide bond formation protein B [Hyphomicrobiales bacterium]